MVVEMRSKTAYSIGRACKVLNLGKATVYYKTKKDDTPIITYSVE